MNIQDYILYIFLKKLYCYYDYNLDTSIFKYIPRDYIMEYLRPIIYLLDTTNNKYNVINFINLYYKKRYNYPKEYRISRLESKIIKLIIKEEKNIKNYYLNILENNSLNEYETPKTDFMTEKAKEYIKNTKKRYYKK